jgi:hypothetical protein
VCMFVPFVAAFARMRKMFQITMSCRIYFCRWTMKKKH